MDIVATYYEGTSGHLEGEHVDQDGVGFQPTALTFSLYDWRTKAIINSKDETVLTPVSDYIDGSGNFDFDLAIADNVFVDDTLREETHIARFTTTWSAGARKAIFIIPISVIHVHDA